MHLHDDLLLDGLNQIGALRPALEPRAVQIARHMVDGQMIHHRRQTFVVNKMVHLDAVAPPRHFGQRMTYNG